VEPKATMKAIEQLLNGKKTYLLALVGAIYLFGGDQGWWVISDAILGMLGFGTAAAFRHGMKKAEDHIVEEVEK